MKQKVGNYWRNITSKPSWNFRNQGIRENNQSLRKAKYVTYKERIKNQNRSRCLISAILEPARQHTKSISKLDLYPYQPSYQCENKRKEKRNQVFLFLLAREKKNQWERKTGSLSSKFSPCSPAYEQRTALLWQSHGAQASACPTRPHEHRGPNCPRLSPDSFLDHSALVAAEKVRSANTWEKDSKLWGNRQVQKLDSEFSWSKTWSDSLCSVAICPVCK